ncbi:MAG: CvpA family protein [Pseudolabrys sp.]|jgi:membrane protein required for colicin V production
MPITLLDVLLLVVMLISGLLAMIRGFMREILSIAAWIVAALAALAFYARLAPFVKSYVGLGDTATNIIAAAIVFLVTLIVVAVVTVRISDMVLDSRVGALDRTLGFLFGLGRGLLVVVVAFVFFVWLVPEHSQPTWIKDAKSRVVLQSTGQWLESLLPENLDATISDFRQRKRQEQEPADAAPDQRTDLQPSSGTR